MDSALRLRLLAAALLALAPLAPAQNAPATPSTPSTQSAPAPPPTWRTKPLDQWTAADSTRFLIDSPWAHTVTPAWLRDLSPGERRDSGDWDASTGKGVGIAGLFTNAAAADAIKRAHLKPPAPPVVIRWESALPVRAAEVKAGESGIFDLPGDEYAIAVYNMQVPDKWRIEAELKGVSFLRRDKKKDFHPNRVQITRNADGTATVLYLFPRSTEITAKDGHVTFVAQVGRLFLAQDFYMAQMQLDGRMEILMPATARK